MEGETLLIHGLDVVGFYHFAWLVHYSNFGSVQVRYHEIDACQCLQQGDLFFHQQVCAFSLEQFVGLLLHDDDDIAGFDAWVLVSLSVESVLLAIGCALINLSIEDLLFLAHLLAVASLALVLLVDHLALTSAGIARTGRLSVHTRSQLLHLRHLAATFALTALLDRTLFTTLAVASAADSLTVDGNLGRLAHIDLFEGNFQRMLHGLHLLGTSVLSATATTEHLTQDVIHAATATTAFLKTLLAIFIVNLALLFIHKHFVGALELLELFFVTTTIRVMLQCEFAENFLDLVLGSCLGNTEQLVKLIVVDLFGWASATTHFFESAAHSAEWEATAAKEHFCCCFKLIIRVYNLEWNN